MWILDHLGDIESDLSAVHRVDDIGSMPADRFVRLVERLWHYPGAVRAAVFPPRTADVDPVEDGQDDGLVDLSEFGDVVEFAEGG